MIVKTQTPNHQEMLNKATMNEIMEEMIAVQASCKQICLLLYAANGLLGFLVAGGFFVYKVFHNDIINTVKARLEKANENIV